MYVLVYTGISTIVQFYENIIYVLAVSTVLQLRTSLVRWYYLRMPIVWRLNA